MSTSYSGGFGLERTTWPNKLEYHLSLFSFLIGLCTFWRFPYLAYENDGAPFLYAFLVLYILVGIPLVFLEMAWGQYSNLAPIQAFKIVPAMQGVGVCMLVLSCALLIYCGVVSYNILLYLATSFSTPLPYTTCGNSWNTEACQVDLRSDCVMMSPDLLYQDGSYGIEVDGQFVPKMTCNYTSDGTQTSPTIEYWTNNLMVNDAVCSYYSDIDSVLFGADSALLIPTLAVLFGFVGLRFILTVLAMAKHVRFRGKIAYLLSTIPFAVIVMLLVRCVTLSGSVDGIMYLFVPKNLRAFMSYRLWKDAMGQVFFSLLTSWGGLLVWGSYNRFYNKYHVDAALLIPIIPLLSALSAVSVFSVIGFIAKSSGLEISEAMRGAKGPFTPLVAYSEAMNQMWGNPVPWSIVVYSSLFLSSTTALLPTLECIMSCISDSILAFRGLALRNITIVVLMVASMAGYYGVPCILHGSGIQIIDFFDTFALPFSFIMVTLAELLFLSYSFGFKLLGTNTSAMTGNPGLKSHFWSVMWGGVCPLILMACLVYSIVGVILQGTSALSPVLSTQPRETWVDIAGMSLVGFLLFILVVVAIARVIQSHGNSKEKFSNAFTPHFSRLSGNGRDHSNGNGDLFMSDYTHQGQQGLEVLIDEDIVTSV